MGTLWLQLHCVVYQGPRLPNSFVLRTGGFGLRPASRFHARDRTRDPFRWSRAVQAPGTQRRADNSLLLPRSNSTAWRFRSAWLVATGRLGRNATKVQSTVKRPLTPTFLPLQAVSAVKQSQSTLNELRSSARVFRRVGPSIAMVFLRCCRSIP